MNKTKKTDAVIIKMETKYLVTAWWTDEDGIEQSRELWPSVRDTMTGANAHIMRLSSLFPSYNYTVRLVTVKSQTQ